MNTTKLHELIQTKNERLEREAVQTAEQHIEAIIQLTEAVTEAQGEIKAHQAALKALEVKSVDAASILGE